MRYRAGLGLLLLGFLLACGRGSDLGLRTARARVTLSDPPLCRVPLGPYEHVWVTITRVRAHRNAHAEPDDSGWVDLVDRRERPIQVDLLNLPGTDCLMSELGVEEALLPGDFEVVHVVLLEPSPPPGTPVPQQNQCQGTGSWHCVTHVSDGLRELEIGGPEQTTIPVPRIVGGSIPLRRNATTRVNLEFDACSSVVRMAAGRFRLRPGLHASELAGNQQTIRGRAVNATNGQPITDATIVALAELADREGIDRVVAQALGNSQDATFALCPVPDGDLDVVVAAQDSTGQTWGATVAFSVPDGADLGDVPLFPLPAGTAGTLAGTVTSSAPGGVPAGADVELAALQLAVPPGRPPLLVTIPVFESSSRVVATERSASCPPGTSCAAYTLVVPARNPSVGLFAPGRTVYSAPAPEGALYTVAARAFLPRSTGRPDCLPPFQITSLDAQGMPLVAPPGGAVTVATLAFTGCLPYP